MSSEVQAKWIIPGGTLIPIAAIFSVRKYSIAFTSWLVVRSSSFTAARVGERELVVDQAQPLAPTGAIGVNASIAGFAASASYHSISTRTR